jgi:hypothetical protein
LPKVFFKMFNQIILWVHVCLTLSRQNRELGRHCKRCFTRCMYTLVNISLWVFLSSRKSYVISFSPLNLWCNELINYSVNFQTSYHL